MRVREWIRNWLGVPLVPPVDQQFDTDLAGRRISTAALWEAKRTGRPAALPEETFARPLPPPGVLPAGMAMDSLPVVAPINSWALQTIFHEGLAFLGYPYLAELAQRVEMRHVSEIWAEHATRKWIKLRGPDEQVKAIEAEFERLGVRDAFYRSWRDDGLFGRAQVFLDFDDYDRPNELTSPLVVDPRKISPKRPLKRLRTLEPMWSYPGTYPASNPLDPSFYKPEHWYIYGRTVHDTRLLTFISNEVPDMLKPAYAFGGLSRTQMVKAYVDNFLRARQSNSDLLNAFSQMVLATDMASTLTGGSGLDLFDRVDMFNDTRSNRGTMVIDKNGETLENIATPLAGLRDLGAQSQEQIASAARIPLSIYLQITPGGLDNSTEDEIRSFYADVNALQENDRPNLKRLLDIVQLSLFGAIDETVTVEFVPLWEMSETERVETRDKEADTDVKLIGAGVISNEESRQRLVNDENGPYYRLTGAAPELEPDDDDPADDA